MLNNDQRRELEEVEREARKEAQENLEQWAKENNRKVPLLFREFDGTILAWILIALMLGIPLILAIFD